MNDSKTKEQLDCISKFPYSTNRNICSKKIETLVKENCNYDLSETERLKMLKKKKKTKQILSKLRDQNQEMKITQKNFEELRSSITVEDFGLGDYETLKEKIASTRKSKTYKKFPFKNSDSCEN